MWFKRATPTTMLILVMVPINQSYGSNSVKSVRVPAHVILAMCFCQGSESLAAMHGRVPRNPTGSRRGDNYALRELISCARAAASCIMYSACAGGDGTIKQSIDTGRCLPVASAERPSISHQACSRYAVTNE